MKRRGAIREVETMCQSGIRTANHRAFGANWKKVEENDLVMIDIGCVYKGYGSDLTRTWVVGKPTDAHKKIADDIVRTHEKVIEFMQPGVTLGEIQALGRNEMKKAGYITRKGALPSNGECLGGVTVHGLGLGPMHDPPHVEDLDLKLESGMTLAVAGGVRHEAFTIRFEDDVVVIPGGVEKLNDPMPWEL
jgi:Xaa-Pro aminopeptidase